ncbi:MAG: PAS domain-containing protein [Hymenobacter sp.]
MFEQAPVAIAVLRGPEYVIEVANPLVAGIWGRTPEQVLGKPTAMMPCPKLRGQGFKELLDQVVATGEAFVAQEVPGSAAQGRATDHGLPQLRVPAPTRRARGASNAWPPWPPT